MIETIKFGAELDALSLAAAAAAAAAARLAIAGSQWWHCLLFVRCLRALEVARNLKLRLRDKNKTNYARRRPADSTQRAARPLAAKRMRPTDRATDRATAATTTTPTPTTIELEQWHLTRPSQSAPRLPPTVARRPLTGPLDGARARAECSAIGRRVALRGALERTQIEI